MVYNKCSIIVNPDSSCWDFARKVYEELRKRSDNFDLNKVIIKKFRDGELKPKIENNIRERKCFFIHDSNLNPSQWFLELCLINNAMINSSAYKIIIISRFFHLLDSNYFMFRINFFWN